MADKRKASLTTEQRSENARKGSYTRFLKRLEAYRQREREKRERRRGQAE